MSERKITGLHVAGIFGLGFSIIIAVNVTMAVNAVRTFPGLESRNSYIDSQSFNDRRAAQDALDWVVDVQMRDGMITLQIDGDTGPVQAATLQAELGRATERDDDVTLDLSYSNGQYSAPLPALGDGRWVLRLLASAPDGTVFQKHIRLWVGA